jgi:protein-tyrosine phosphatase
MYAVPSQILNDRLFLGSKSSAKDTEYLTSTGIQVVVSILTKNEVHDYFHDTDMSKFEWHHFEADDVFEENISQHFEDSHKVISTALKDGKKVLVHCAGGISRSPTIVCAYLMQENGWSRKEAIEYVSKRRLVIEPNDGFMDQLKSLEVFMEIHKD